MNRIIQIKKFSFFLRVFFFVIVLQSCNSKENSYYEDLIGKHFELLEDSFFFRWTSGNYDIDLPGKFSFHANVPFSTEDYLKFPNSWEKSENYTNAFGNLSYSKDHIIGILEKGIKVRFIGIDKSYSWGYIETILYPLVEIENGPYKGQITRISLIRLFPPDPPRISKYLKQID
jgi:hypothetical protein